MTSSIWRLVRVIRCRWPTGRGRGAGQGDVDRGPRRGGPRARAASSSAARASSICLERLPGLVGAAADRAALLRREVGDPAQDPGQLGLAAEVADPQLLELGGAARRRDRRLGLACDLLDPLEHQHLAGLRHRRGDDIRSQAIAAAAATLSDSAPPGRRGIVSLASHSREHLGGQALALGAEAERRPAPIRARRVPRRRGRPARPAAPGSRRPRPAPAAWRRSSPCSPGPPSARTGSAQPGPRTTVPSSRASAVRMIVPTLPGSPTPCR